MGNHSESKLAATIRKLMAKANDKSVTEAEAAMYAAKVQELLVKNGLSMADVKQDEVERGDVGQHRRPDTWKSPSRRELLRAVCRYYMCEAIRFKEGYWIIVGRPHNVDVAVSITDYLVKTVIRLSNQYGRDNLGADVIDFRKGCMRRLSERLWQMVHEAHAARKVWTGPANANPGNLPALFESEHVQNRRYMHEKMSVKFSSPRDIKMGSDAAAGRRAGDRISLQPQVGAKAGGRLALGSR